MLIPPGRAEQLCAESPKTCNTFRLLRRIEASHPWVSPSLSPGACLPALMPPCTCWVQDGWVWWYTRSGTGCIYQVVYTRHTTLGGVYPPYYPGCTMPPYYPGVYYASLLPWVWYRPCYPGVVPAMLPGCYSCTSGVIPAHPVLFLHIRDTFWRV